MQELDFGLIPFDIPLVQEVEEKLEALQEPDFVESVDTLAKAHCGRVFRVDEETTIEEPMPGRVHAMVARVFDEEGRLQRIEERTTGENALWPVPDGEGGTRLQLDYDDAGRVTRVRRGSLVDNGVPLGTVIELAHAADGSVVAQMATTEVGPAAAGSINPSSPLGFCERMEFDANMRLVRTSWGCGEPREARSFRYDAQGRLQEATGSAGLTSVSPAAFGESPAWTIHWNYESDERVVVTWNETDLRSGQPVEVAERLVHSLDGQGRITVSEFDYGDDGVFDERIEYTYPDDASPSWNRLAYDAGLDGLFDVVEEHRDDNDGSVIQFRNMAQLGDEKGFFRVVGLLRTLSGGYPLDSPQSVDEWVLSFDGDGRVETAELTARDVIRFGTRVTSTRSSQQQTFDAEGYVDHVAVTEEAEDGAGEIAHREASCSFEPACEGGDGLPLPADAALIACQTEVGVRSAVPRVPLASPPYVPPPFDGVPGMRLRNEHALSFDPTPPNVREIVGY